MWKQWYNNTYKALTFQNLQDARVIAEMIHLANFTDPNSPTDYASWLLQSDAMFKGKSRGEWGHDAEHGCGRFHGAISLEITEEMRQKSAKRTGFASISSPKLADSHGGDLDLEAHGGVRLTVKPCDDRRLYVFNMTPVLYGEDRLLQSKFQVPGVETAGGAPWVNVDLHFSRFIRTWKGHVDGPAQAFDFQRIERFGILMAERREGPFDLRIKEIQVIPYSELPQKRYTIVPDWDDYN